MQPKVDRLADGSVTISLTLPAGSDCQSLLNAEEQLLESLNAMGREHGTRPCTLRQRWSADARRRHQMDQ